MKQEFYSHGKLLITGEYVVLDGAKALAIPTKKGQSLIVETNDTKDLKWESYDCHGNIWYETTIETSSLFNDKAPVGNSKFDTTLFKILWEALHMNPKFLDNTKGYLVKTHLEFERLWGLGTSSTLINNIAQWAKINPFELLNNSFGGSGYDIASAEAKTPILYQRTKDLNTPIIEKAPEFNPIFKDEIYFVYLENKKDSKDAITNYRSKSISEIKSVISEIETITQSIIKCTTIKEFETLIDQHEDIISKILNCKTIKQERFPDYHRSIKSLGGWGGDFVMVNANKTDLNYFTSKNYITIINFESMIWNKN